MLSIALRVLAILVVGYAIVMFLAWRFQHRIAFPAPGGPLPPPSAFGMPDGRIVTVLTTDSVALRGWYLPPAPAPGPGAEAPAVIWFHGNMETVGGIGSIIREFRPPGVGLLALDYRGYGQSDGEPTERGVYRDAEAAWDFVVRQPELDETRIAVYGRSIGSAVALYLAGERPVAAVVLESAFTTGRDMAREHYALVPPGLVNLGLNNLDRAGRLTVPLLVIHGTDDWIAPIDMGRAVADTGRAEEFFVLQGAGHNDTYDVGGTPYRDRVLRFLTTHLQRTR